MQKSQPLQTSFVTDNKDNKKFTSQLESVQQAFEDKPKTMWQVSIQTKITRPNVCRHVSTLRKTKRIALLHKGLCPISKYSAGFYTTNEDLFPSDPQLKLF